jgi:hypothetical protein
MLPLLNRVLEAHGGLEQWRRFTRIEIDAVTGGGLFPLKGLQSDLATRRMTVWLKEERASVHPFGGPDQRTSFTPRRLAIEKLDGTVVIERAFPVSDFIGHGMSTAWQPIHRAYFNGYAMWTYLNTPFLLQMDGVEVEEAEPWHENDETWQVLRAFLPGRMVSHCEPQTLPCLPGPRSTLSDAVDPERPNRTPSRPASRHAVSAIKAPGRCRRSYQGRSPSSQSIIQKHYCRGAPDS